MAAITNLATEFDLILWKHSSGNDIHSLTHKPVFNCPHKIGNVKWQFQLNTAAISQGYTLVVC